MSVLRRGPTPKRLQHMQSLGPQSSARIIASPFDPQHLVINSPFDSVVSYDGEQSFVRVDGADQITFVDASGLLVMQPVYNRKLYFMPRDRDIWVTMQQPEGGIFDIFATGSVLGVSSHRIWHFGPIDLSGQVNCTKIDLDALWRSPSSSVAFDRPEES